MLLTIMNLGFLHDNYYFLYKVPTPNCFSGNSRDVSYAPEPSFMIYTILLFSFLVEPVSPLIYQGPYEQN